MECQEAERLVMPYIQDELPTPVLEEFLEHIQVCPQCQEELEIYFTVAEGLRHLEEETGSYNIRGEMERVLEASRQRVQLARLVKIIYYAVNTLASLGLFVTFLLQLRIWHTGG